MPVVLRRLAKRSQGWVRAGLMSNEEPEIRSAEVVQLAEGKTGGTELARGWGSAVKVVFAGEPTFGKKAR